MQINMKNHLSCSPAYDEVYGFSGKQKNCKLSESSIRKAIKLIFEKLAPAQENELVKIAKSDFHKHGCVVWRKQNVANDFNEFLVSNSLNIGKKEVIILGDGKSVQYTDDYFYHPELV